MDAFLDAFSAFALDPQVPPVFLRRSNNEVWRAQDASGTVYLRITPAEHRTPKEVAAEVAWMRALNRANLRVVRPVEAKTGELVVPIRWQDAPATLTCFSAAPGRHARKPDDYAPPVVASWAALLANLHRHARDHHADAPVGRAAWDTDRVFLTARTASGRSMGKAAELLTLLCNWMKRLPTPAEAFGLTHADLHLGNLSVDPTANDAVTAFDFDDSCRHWYLHDVAVAVTSIRKAGAEYPGAVDAARVEDQFLTQYFARTVLPAAWRQHLEAFVGYRIALSACWAEASFERNELEADMLAWYERSIPWWLGELERREAEIRAATGH